MSWYLNGERIRVDSRVHISFQSFCIQDYIGDMLFEEG